VAPTADSVSSRLAAAMSAACAGVAGGVIRVFARTGSGAFATTSSTVGLSAA